MIAQTVTLHLAELPKPLDENARRLLEIKAFYETLVRQYFDGTGKVTITLDFKDYHLRGIRGNVEGPTERL